jgi:macrophage erythroblast attacher
LQQVIELARSRDSHKLADARMHARKYLAGHPDTKFAYQAAMLLAIGPDAEVDRYRVRSRRCIFPDDPRADMKQALYSPDRWSYLANLFQKTYYDLFSLPSRPLLHIALSAGLSALKTPSCHSAYAPTISSSNSSTTTVCPICSTELNELARNVPYAHHTKSYVENDLVVLPNGRIYGRERLNACNEKLGTKVGKVRDPMNLSTLFDEKDVKKVFIS